MVTMTIQMIETTINAVAGDRTISCEVAEAFASTWLGEAYGFLLIQVRPTVRNRQHYIGDVRRLRRLSGESWLAVSGAKIIGRVVAVSLQRERDFPPSHAR